MLQNVTYQMLNTRGVQIPMFFFADAGSCLQMLMSNPPYISFLYKIIIQL